MYCQSLRGWSTWSQALSALWFSQKIRLGPRCDRLKMSSARRQAQLLQALSVLSQAREMTRSRPQVGLPGKRQARASCPAALWFMLSIPCLSQETKQEWQAGMCWGHRQAVALAGG